MPIIRLHIENIMTPETSVAQTTKQEMLVVNACCCHLCVCNRTSTSRQNLMDRQAKYQRTGLDVKNYGLMNLLNRKWVLEAVVECDSKE